MQYRAIQSCAVTLILLTTLCGSFPTLQREGFEEFFRREDRTVDHSLKRRTIRSALEDSSSSSSSSEELEEVSLEVDGKNYSSETDKVVAAARSDIILPPENITIENREDTGVIQKRESSKGFTSGPNFDTDRIGLLQSFLPFLGYKSYRPYSGRAHWYTSRPHKPPHHPPNHYKPSPHPSSHYSHKPHYKPPKPHYESHEQDYEHPKPLYEPHPPDYDISYKPHESDYSEAPKPEPLPPFPPDGPTFVDYMADFPGHVPPFPSNEEDEKDEDDYDGPSKPHLSDHESFNDESFKFDFDPPDFFEQSGFPHPPEDEYEEPHYPTHEEEDEDDEHYDPHHDEGDNSYPMKPYSDDDEIEFFPPDSYEGFEPIIYNGPPKPHKHITAGPKPGPPPPPNKFKYPPDLNTIIEEGIYRGDIPIKEIHNDRDKVTEDLDPGGIKGLDPDIIDFIQTNTKPYVDSQNGFDDHFSRKITSSR